MIRPTKKQIEYLRKIEKAIGSERMTNFLIRNELPRRIDWLSLGQAQKVIAFFINKME